MNNATSTVTSVIKSVGPSTSMHISVLNYDGKECYALFDQDNEVIGFIGRDRPYLPLGSIYDVMRVAEKGLIQGAQYLAYPVELRSLKSALGFPVYQLECAEETDSLDTLLQRAEKLKQEAKDFYGSLSGSDSSVIEGEFTVKK